MLNLTGREHGVYVQKLFTHIAHHYELINRLITSGLDVQWRKELIQYAHLKPGAKILDLGTGTGSLAREILQHYPDVKLVAADFTVKLMRIGNLNGRLPWAGADALNLPFEENTFDVIVSGFLMRNVSDIQQALKEQKRTLKPGGRIVILDTSKPKPNLFSPILRFYLQVIIPLIGSLLTGMKDTHKYLTELTEDFISDKEMVVRMAAVGFKKINFETRMLGTIAIHWGETKLE
ncbi:MAG: ubiquinone/menaquinone biosynthesis methyltransferase [Anaerolineae bacterium]|nr:ubiquinone/menaquinone biosynthesis methyltransferase [Anaerolineae bacterium]MDK1117873.1 ubiquinone/menaquinone biosynthesis methyltransferase [Anaerolineae bacterium]